MRSERKSRNTKYFEGKPNVETVTILIYRYFTTISMIYVLPLGLSWRLRYVFVCQSLTTLDIIILFDK